MKTLIALGEGLTVFVLMCALFAFLLLVAP